MIALIRKLVTKSPKDYAIFFRRKAFLLWVKKIHRHKGNDYFFSTSYLKRHYSVQSLEQLVDLFKANNLSLIEEWQAVSHQMLSKEWKKNTDELLKSASSMLRHEFDLLGSGCTDLNHPALAKGIEGIRYTEVPNSKPIRSPLLPKTYQMIDWHIDFKSGYRWQVTDYYPKAREYINSHGADIKVPWELSRCQHLPTLGLAYLVTQDSVFADEIYFQIIDWIDNNPICMGPNWNCAMEVGIRVANWLVALELIRNYQHEDNDSRLATILMSITQHLEYLLNNFEWTSSLTSNHYVANLAGAFFCLSYLPQLKKLSEYQSIIVNELEKEIIEQFYADGMNKEGSLLYHKLVFEMFFFCALLDSKAQCHFSERFYSQITSVAQFSCAVIRPDNTAPQIGDNDGGVFVNLSNLANNDWRHIRVFRDLLCGINSDKRKVNDCMERLLLSFANRKKNTRSESIIKSPYFDLFVFNESGLAVAKSENLFMSFYYGRNGQRGRGGHCHNDRLSLTLCINGVELLTDPGTGVYTPFPIIRNSFRSTSFHNTVSFNGQEQNNIPQSGYLFAIDNDISDIQCEVTVQEDNIKFSGHHDGFKKCGAIHHREASLFGAQNMLVIKDTIDSEVSKVSQLVFIIRNYEGLNLSVDQNRVESAHFLLEFTEHDSITLDEIPYSPNYGEIIPKGCVRVTVDFHQSIETKLRWSPLYGRV